VSAVPTKSNYELGESLDEPIDNEQEITLIPMSSKELFKIKRNVAKQSNLLKIMMNNDREETNFVIELTPKQLEIVIHDRDLLNRL
jgi:hypothetical protein